MPSGLFPPLGLSMRTRRTGVHCHLSYLIASMILAIFSCDIPSTVSSVIPGVIAPSFLYSLVYDRRYMSGLYSCLYTSSSGSLRLPRSWIMFRIVSAVRISRTLTSFPWETCLTSPLGCSFTPLTHHVDGFPVL